jgi:hypothetical protein
VFFILGEIARFALKPKPHTFSDKRLGTLQRLTFDYFLKEMNLRNGLGLGKQTIEWQPITGLVLYFPPLSPCIPCMLMSIFAGRTRKNTFQETGLAP